VEQYARFLVRRAWLVLLGVAIATVGIGLGLRQLRTEFSVEASLPANHPLIEIDKKIRRQFGGHNTVIGLIVPKEGDVWRPEVLDVVQQATFAALHLEGVMAQNVVSLAAPSVRVVEDTDGRLEVNYLMHDVPQTPEAVAALRAKVDGDPQFRGMLVTPDQRGAVLVADFWDGNASVDIAHRLLALRDQFRDKAGGHLLRRRADRGAHRRRAVDGDGMAHPGDVRRHRAHAADLVPQPAGHGDPDAHRGAEHDLGPRPDGPHRPGHRLLELRHPGAAHRRRRRPLGADAQTLHRGRREAGRQSRRG
jgi:hypothetical protein